jgi:KDO2-lipid IV(A) lauroyltransferase
MNRASLRRASSALYYRAEYGAFRAIAAVLKSFGVDRASALSGKLWQVLAPRTHRHQAALRHLELAFPQKSLEERELIARDVWDNLGRTTAEALLIEKIAAEPWRIHIKSPDVMEIIAREKGRVVVASMHAANWELIAPAFKAAGFPMAFIYQRVKNPHAELYLRRLRLKVFPGGVYPKGDAAPRRLISWLKSGNPVLILADQRTGDVLADFFGHPAPSTPLPVFMARSFDAPLIAARLVRTRGAHFDLYLEVVPVAHSTSRERDVTEATGVLQALFESWIREIPGQWMWAHRRWHRQGPPLGWSSPSAAQNKTRDPKAARRKSKS